MYYLCVGECMSSYFDDDDYYDDEEYSFDSQSVIKIPDVDSFIIWLRKQALRFALTQIGKNFFDDPEMYIDEWDNYDPDQEDLTDDDVVEELSQVLYVEKGAKGDFYIKSQDASDLIGNLTGKLIYVFLNHLVDDGVLEMCWNSETDNFMWRVSLK